ncbi:SseB family protein [Actinotalea sp. Marseille-Q4924]|uniref:SseB family protein n=1 Tax=Actinotalea sp. Marseille-Q4924 TaxID=2866571 RepID=UPI001CE4094E|nr:SseB family protein [Actinotalea sp. Marseille-Q4924]
MTGKALPPTSAFAGDDGSADPGLAAAVTAWADGRATLADVVTALADARVLVPVLAEVEASGTTAAGLHVDKEASTGVVALATPDGRTALPVFTSTASLGAWRSDARPVPAEGPRAAAAALQEGWEVLVVDPGGPVAVPVPRTAVRALALGTTWRPAVVDGAVVDEVRSAVSVALEQVPEVRAADAVPGRRAEVAVVVALAPGLDREDLDRVLRRVGAALAAEEVVAARVDSLEMRVVTARP